MRRHLTSPRWWPLKNRKFHFMCRSLREDFLLLFVCFDVTKNFATFYFCVNFFVCLHFLMKHCSTSFGTSCVLPGFCVIKLGKKKSFAVERLPGIVIEEDEDEKTRFRRIDLNKTRPGWLKARWLRLPSGGWLVIRKERSWMIVDLITSLIRLINSMAGLIKLLSDWDCDQAD